MEPVAVILLCSRVISIQTAEDSVANIVVGGPSVLVEPNASVKFKGSAVGLAGGQSFGPHFVSEAPQGSFSA